MDLTNILNVSGAILASLGSGVAIVFGFSSWLGKVWANRLMANEKAAHERALEALKNELLYKAESYKLKLKKSEFLFEKEYEAVSEFVSLRRSFLPTFSNPKMDLKEAYKKMALNSANIENELGCYISKHGAILSEVVKDLICEAEGVAGRNKFEIESSHITINVVEATEKMFEKLTEAEIRLISEMRSQSST